MDACNKIKVLKTETVVMNLRILINHKNINFWLKSSTLSCLELDWKLILMVLILVKVKHILNTVVNSKFIIIPILKFAQPVA